MNPPRLKTWQRAAIMMLMVAAGFGFLAWQRWRNPAVMFLPSDRRAEWILFPAKANVWPYTVADLQVVFSREWVVSSPNTTAELKVRAARRFQARINGQAVEFPAVGNWKRISSIEAGRFLKAGTNLIEVAVVNDTGPALLWLELDAGGEKLRSDTNWVASAGGSAWRAAAVAGPVFPGPGNTTQIGEGSVESLGRVWPWWAAFVALALAAYGSRARWLAPAQEKLKDRKWLLDCWPLAGVCVVLIVLFFNNLPFLTGSVGFDVNGHRNYIAYLQEHRKLPWPNEGWEMFQPPLYYLVSAVGLGIFGLAANSGAGEVAVRGLGLLIALGQCGLIFLAMRRLVPERRGPRLVGFAVAALVPMHLYLVGSVGNEALGALLVSLVTWLFLRLMESESVSWRQAAVFGVAIGLAMLTKVTVLLVFPLLLGVWTVRLWRGRAVGMVWMQTIGVTVLAALAVCGWHYVRIWIRYGTPIIGNWDPAVGYHWWQMPGYHTAGDYFRFGRSLLHPFWSAFNGFPDAMYSTLFGDGEYLSQGEFQLRTPWNYQVMAAGYLLAVAPAALLVTGLAVALGRLARKPEVRDLAMVGMCGAVGFGIVFMSMKIASFAQMKAFYGLCLLIPFGYFAAQGWEVLTRNRAGVRLVLGVLLGLWCANNAASLFVMRHSAAARYALGTRAAKDGRWDAARSELEKALGLEPDNVRIKIALAGVLLEGALADEALKLASGAVTANPPDFGGHLLLGAVYQRLGQMERAVEETRRAIALGPESIEAFHQLSTMLAQAGRSEEAMVAAREGLAVEPHDVFLRDLLGRLLVGRGDLDGAREQLEMAVAMDSDYAPAQLHLGQLLLRQGDFVAAGSRFIEYRRAQPEDPDGLHLVALAHLGLGNEAKAMTNLMTAARLAPDNAAILGDLGWLLATATEAEVRNGQQAVVVAERACALVNRRDARLVGVLAAVYAEAGRFPEAVRTAQESVSLAQAAGDRVQEELAGRMLAEFQANRAYRQARRGP